jgi:hypothetical protein
MAIENRNLTPGTQLVARFKKEQHTCTVEQGEDDKLVFVLADGSRHKSPSAAGSAVMGGTACNGWRFWSLTSDSPAATEAPAATSKARKGRKGSTRLIKRMATETGMPEGEARFFCSACMDSFAAPADAEPDHCPKGHPATAEPATA